MDIQDETLNFLEKECNLSKKCFTTICIDNFEIMDEVKRLCHLARFPYVEGKCSHTGTEYDETIHENILIIYTNGREFELKELSIVFDKLNNNNGFIFISEPIETPYSRKVVGFFTRNSELCVTDIPFVQPHLELKDVDAYYQTRDLLKSKGGLELTEMDNYFYKIGYDNFKILSIVHTVNLKPLGGFFTSDGRYGLELRRCLRLYGRYYKNNMFKV